MGLGEPNLINSSIHSLLVAIHTRWPFPAIGPCTSLCPQSKSFIQKTFSKKEKIKKILFVAVVAFSLTSCDKNENGGKDGTFKGPQAEVHGGKAWTWVKLDKQGNPQQIAITLDDAAMNSVPVGGTGGHDHSGGNYWLLKFNPVTEAVIPFNFVMLNWNPIGHEPEQIYGKPHFDFHFYSQTIEQVSAIPPYEVDSAKFKNAPAPEYFPANYVNAGGGVPQMGAHWIDVTSGELNGQPFTETFLFGSFDGKITFYEPMITKAFLESQTNYQRAIPVPTKFQQDGWYPTAMRIVRHDGQTDVVLDKFVYRHKS